MFLILSMKHGNKKYNFEDLKEIGDKIEVETANIYSLKNSLRTFCKEQDLAFKGAFEYNPLGNGLVLIERIF